MQGSHAARRYQPHQFCSDDLKKAGIEHVSYMALIPHGELDIRYLDTLGEVERSIGIRAVSHLVVIWERA